ncbi:MAG TPA: NADH-quinone oxidoreductase subunit NuoN [Gammaproteobacteria bacterium]|nr:NADH-quinone oxidoreductase subunit NuoN [Gammaproteobacteria bacterium]
MNFTAPAFAPAIPEMFVFGMACFILLVDVYAGERRRVVTYWLSLATLAGAAWLTASLTPTTQITFDGMFVNDKLAQALKLFTYVITAAVFLYSRDYLQQRNQFKGEFYVLGLFGMLGVMILISAHSLLTLYIGLELLSLCQYALIALDRDSGVASESAMKYFILGAVASAILLYGMSILYGITGTLDLGQLALFIAGTGFAQIGLIFAVGFVVVALAFKFGAVPFHMWLPDVYEGARTPITLYVGSIPKIAAFVMFIRLLAQGLGGLHPSWEQMLIAISVLSMAVGSVLAIAQTNMKRMLGYSTISHVGYILLGILAGTQIGYEAAMFYTITYVIMATAAFGMVILLSRRGFEGDMIADFKGLNERSPWFAAMMLCVMFGMTGAPPFLGFFAKLYVIEAVLNVGMVWLAVVAVLFAVISAFYYLRVVKFMYFDHSDDKTPLEGGWDLKWVLSGNSLAILALGIAPAPLMALCVHAFGL